MHQRASTTDPTAPAFRDPLANLYARKRIGHAQYLAGREFQRVYHLADKRRPDQMDGLAEDQVKAWQLLTRCYQILGADGSAIVCDVLIRGLSAGEVAKARGKTGEADGRFYRMRLAECLGTLAAVFGYASGDRAVTATPPISGIHTATGPSRGGSAGSTGG